MIDTYFPSIYDGFQKKFFSRFCAIHIHFFFFEVIPSLPGGVTISMRKKILSFLKTLPLKELKQFRRVLDQIIQNKLHAELKRRSGQRARVKIPATANIEREAEFFHKEYRITIHDLSTNGLLFTTEAPIINSDILAISFRSPHNGEQRNINCQAVRVKENHQHSHWEYEVGAKAVDKQAVRAYREMLKNRGRF